MRQGITHDGLIQHNHCHSRARNCVYTGDVWLFGYADTDFFGDVLACIFIGKIKEFLLMSTSKMGSWCSRIFTSAKVPSVFNPSSALTGLPE